MDHRTQLPRALPRRQFLRMAGSAAVAAPIAALGWQASAQAAPVTGRPCGPDGPNVELHELFADDVNIASVDGFVRGVVPASRLDDPVIQPELSWETYATYLYGTVLPDEANGGYRMWYHTGRICYARSDDGVHWEKPALGLNYIDGQDSNWVFNPTSTTAPELSSVLYEPDDPDPNRRYKMMFSTGNSFFNVAFSPDGFHWTEPSPTAVLRAGSEIANVVRDPATGLYLAYIRSEPAKAYPVGLSGRRRIALCTSPDFLNWSAKTAMIDPDAIDDAWVTDPSVQRTEFYGMAGVPYAGQWLGLLPTFRVTEIISPHPSTQSAFEGPIHCELVSSRDGQHWDRCSDRSPVLPNGPEGSFDAGCIMNVGSAPVIVGDEVWWYYTGINTTHGGLRPPKRICIGRAVWKRDRLVGMHMGPGRGVLETTDITLESHGGPRRLVVNADVKANLKIEVCRPNGEVIHGYDNGQVHGDSLRHQVTWSGHHDYLPNEPVVRLRFSGTQASLYSYLIES